MTTNLGLRKPSENDFIDIEDLNYNVEKLDEKVQEIVENIEGLSGLKDSIQLVTDGEFVRSLINNTAKAGSILLFSNIGEKNGNVTGEGYTLYTGLENCNRYSGCNIMIKTMDGVERNLHPKYFQVPAYFIAKVDKQNTKRVVIYPLGGGNTDEIKSRLDNVEAKVEQAFTQAGEGKKAIVNAFTGLGISASPSETFQSLADKIKNKALSKEKIANALTNKGILTDTNASVEQIVSNIRGIEVLKRSLISYSIINHSYSATFPQYWLQYVGSNRTHDSYGVCVYKILRPFRKAILNMVVVGANSAYDPQYYIGFSRSYDELINNISDGIERPKNIQNHFSLKAINYEGNSGEVAYWFSEEVSFETSMTNLAVYGYSHRYSGSEKALQAYVGTVIILE